MVTGCLIVDSDPYNFLCQMEICMPYHSQQDLFDHASDCVLACSRHVSVNNARLQEVSDNFKKPDRLPDWKDYISAEAQTPRYDIVRAAFEFALNASQNAGYTEPDNHGGVIKWEINGSGSAELKAFFNELRGKHYIPHIHLSEAEVSQKIPPMLNGELVTSELIGRKVPFVEKRLAMFREFAQGGAFSVFENILANAKGSDSIYRLTFENTVVPLRSFFPVSFGEDPLCKKALLMPILLTANAQAHGVDIKTNVPLPADYRLPLTLSRLGILTFSDELCRKVDSGFLFDQNDPMLLAIRGATLLACEQLRMRSGLEPQQLDAALWTAAAPSGQKAAERPGVLRLAPNSYGMFI